MDDDLLDTLKNSLHPSMLALEGDIFETSHSRKERCTSLIDMNLHCPICSNLVLEPTKLSCFHLYCATCLQPSSLCPICNVDVENEIPSSMAGSVLYQSLDEQDAVKAFSFRKRYQGWRCNNSFGAHGEFGDVVDHVRKPGLKNNRKVARREALSEFGFMEFMKSADAIPCPQGCGKDIVYGSLVRHIDATRGDCPASIVSCPFAHAGCAFVSNRALLDAHVMDSQNRKTHLELLKAWNHKIATMVEAQLPDWVPKWHCLDCIGQIPASSYDHNAVFYKGSMLVLGGVIQETRMNKLSILNLEAQQWYAPTIGGPSLPTGVLYQAVVLKDTMYVLGGSSDHHQLLDTIHILPLHNDQQYTWQLPSKIVGNIPTIRYWYAMTTMNDEIYLFGGYGGRGQRLNDFYRLTIGNNECKWTRVLPIKSNFVPPPRSSASIAAIRNQIVLFGGFDGRRRNNDVYIWDGAQWTKPTIHGIPPSVRYNHSSTVFGNRMYVFGGNSGALHNDLHVLEYSILVNEYTWCIVDIPGNLPTPRYWHSAIATNDATLCIFGGYDGCVASNATYVLDVAKLQTKTMADISSIPKLATLTNSTTCTQKPLDL